MVGDLLTGCSMMKPNCASFDVFGQVAFGNDNENNAYNNRQRRKKCAIKEASEYQLLKGIECKESK